MTRIDLGEEGIYFGIKEDTFSVVKSYTGQKPKDMGFDTSYEYTYRIKKLAPDWYSVTGTLKSDEELE